MTAPPERRVVVNADDFALSPAVSRGILRAFREGVLTSTTMLANTEHFEDAVALARDNPGLSLGVHLTLVWGRPLSPPEDVPSLLHTGGRFPESTTSLLRRWLTGRLAEAEVSAELRRQVQRCLDAGLRPTHLDTHKHVHCLPVVFRAVTRVAEEFGIDRVRVPVERPLVARDAGHPRASAAGRRKRRLLALACRGQRRALAARGLRSTDHFTGLELMDRLNGDAFRFIFGHVREGVTELMCHPGGPDGSSSPAAAGPDRERELAALVDPRTREAVERVGVRLIGWRDL